MTDYVTNLGSLQNFEKGGVHVIDDDPKNYVFSNIFEVASKSRPYEKVAVGTNLKYVIEAIRTEGVSGWFAAGHDEAALVMDGEVEVILVKLDAPSNVVPAGKEGTVAVQGDPKGARMGRIIARRGHMVLLPKDAAYQFRSDTPGVMLLQTIQGDLTIERWAEICQTA
jgi:hypothetical protein